jgi:hypothetical protein
MKASLLKVFLMFVASSAFLLHSVYVFAGDTPGSSGYQVIVACTHGQKSSVTGEVVVQCDFTDFMTELNRIINLLLYVITLLAIASFIYAGFKLLFSGGNESALKDAKSIFGKVVLGIIIAFLAWTIVHFILGVFGVNNNYTLLQSS